MNRPFLLVLAIAAVGCGVGVAPPSLTVPMAPSDFGEFALLVYDETGLVTGGRQAERGDGRFPDGEVTAPPESLELTVRWLGGACSHRPTLTLTGDETALHLELHTSPPEWRLPFVSCPAVGLLFGATLSLNVAVEQSAVSSQIRD